ncbi:MAG: MotA/TolQ/ExbB proton channel family protein [Deltaproteobacteria bacterium]|jgi:biopolymer transport protein ExbB|nr:MotA/TolQ/ExbB proton channel family protein [Deltaproteobacteria bacterium]
MWELFQAGGPVMWPLLLCSISSLTVILERAYFWTRPDLAENRAAIETLLEEYQRQEKLDSSGQNQPDHPERKGAIFRVLLAGIAETGLASSKAMEAAALEELRLMRRGMNILDTIITLAPMLGILGTVTGIISSFDILGQSGVEDPKAVVSGIAEALITTAAGLGISIVTVFPFNYFNSRLEDAQDLFEHYGTRLEIAQETLNREKQDC